MNKKKSVLTATRVLIVCLSLAALINHLLNVHHRVNFGGHAVLMATALLQHRCQLV
jgi:hypothetical protein